ncbi:hypothetical protein EWI07_06160 [Sporolactobacillus sp. THM7-4]|nr:hypothetical protein EWI07_06160 [Sporolactobacillus sp. THM7-4]
MVFQNENNSVPYDYPDYPGMPERGTEHTDSLHFPGRPVAPGSKDITPGDSPFPYSYAPQLSETTTEPAAEWSDEAEDEARQMLQSPQAAISDRLLSRLRIIEQRQNQFERELRRLEQRLRRIERRFGISGSSDGYPGLPGGFSGSPGGYPGSPGGYTGSPGGYPGSPGGYTGSPGATPGTSGYPGYPGYPG